ncbi:MAG: hydantoinase B/oxoprolinase family protein [Candidatus Tectomicrobia bacterium]|nr:hydantoinase B/oxoprolinase family protein [Candidatus Tectomicrobia bacterium]
MPSSVVDPITLATVWHTMQTLCREMRHVMDRTAQNYLMGQLHDISVGIWDAQGRTVAVPVGLPVQFLGASFAVKSITEKFKDNLHPGDIILTNDPYHGGHNCHLPDWGFFRPVFFDGELIFITLARAHQEDTGGAYPGGYFPNGYDIHAEGICIPPLKVYEKGVENKDLFELIWNNVRWPQGVRVDNYSMIASTALCEKRLLAMLKKYGKETVKACIDEMIQRTERAVRAEIRKIPAGTYFGESATDDDGTVLDEPVWIRVAVTVKGDRMTLDFSQSDKQRKGFINSVYAATYGNAIAAAVLVFDATLADYHNEGTMRPIEVIAPQGLVVNCEYPATVGASPVNVGIQVMEAVLMALSQAVPQRSIAAWAKHRGDYVFGVDPRTNERYVRTSFDYDGSGGAVWGQDGYQGLSALTALAAVTRGNIEEMEIRIPFYMHKLEFATDLQGAGRWRGGAGVYWEAQNQGSDSGMATGSSDGDTTFGPGAEGGQPCPPCRTYIQRGSQRIRVKPHRLVQLKNKDVVIKISSGGAGVGNPAQRDPQLVALDVRNEIISPAAARKVYKVVVDPATFVVDAKATARLRRGATTKPAKGAAAKPAAAKAASGRAAKQRRRATSTRASRRA